MKTICFAAGELIFREDDPALTMYDINKGSVGIYLDYDAGEKKQLTVLHAGQSFGEMGLIEDAPRSATAVALEDGTTLREIGEEEFFALLQNDPERMLRVMRQLSARIRENTEKYQEACEALSAYRKAESTGAEKSPALDRQLAEIGKSARKKKTHYGLRSSFYQYVMEDLEAYDGKREVVRSPLIERLVVRRIPPLEMHVNPDDEFADPDIGPSDRIIGEYAQEIPKLQCAREPIFPNPIVVYKMAQGGYLILNGHHRWAAAVKFGLKKVNAAIMNPPK